MSRIFWSVLLGFFTGGSVQAVDLEALGRELTIAFKDRGVTSVDFTPDAKPMTPRFVITIHFLDRSERKTATFVNLGDDLAAVLREHVSQTLQNPPPPQVPVTPAPATGFPPLRDRLRKQIQRFVSVAAMGDAAVDVDDRVFSGFAAILGRELGVECQRIGVREGEWSGSNSAVGEPREVLYSITHRGTKFEIAVPYEIDMGMMMLTEPEYLSEGLSLLADGADNLFRSDLAKFAPWLAPREIPPGELSLRTIAEHPTLAAIYQGLSPMEHTSLQLQFGVDSVTVREWLIRLAVTEADFRDGGVEPTGLTKLRRGIKVSVSCGELLETPVP